MDLHTLYPTLDSGTEHKLGLILSRRDENAVISSIGIWSGTSRARFQRRLAPSQDGGNSILKRTDSDGVWHLRGRW